jgi:hypothetical protein
VLDTIIIIDPKYWYISDVLKDNTVPCCQICSISEDIIRSRRRNEPDGPENTAEGNIRFVVSNGGSADSLLVACRPSRTSYYATCIVLSYLS